MATEIRDDFNDAMTDPKQSPPEGARCDDVLYFGPASTAQVGQVLCGAMFWAGQQIAEARAEVASLRAENAELRQEVADAANEWMARLRVVEDERDALRAELEKARAEREEHERSADDYRAEARGLEERVADLIVEATSARAELERSRAWTAEDRPIPEDAQIDAANPAHGGDHSTYERALTLVEAKRSKYALVDLVNWLLVAAERERRRAAEAERAVSWLRTHVGGVAQEKKAAEARVATPEVARAVALLSQALPDPSPPFTTYSAGNNASPSQPGPESMGQPMGSMGQPGPETCGAVWLPGAPGRACRRFKGHPDEHRDGALVWADNASCTAVVLTSQPVSEDEGRGPAQRICPKCQQRPTYHEIGGPGLCGPCMMQQAFSDEGRGPCGYCGGYVPDLRPWVQADGKRWHSVCREQSNTEGRGPASITDELRRTRAELEDVPGEVARKARALLDTATKGRGGNKP